MYIIVSIFLLDMVICSILTVLNLLGSLGNREDHWKLNTDNC